MTYSDWSQISSDQIAKMVSTQARFDQSYSNSNQKVDPYEDLIKTIHMDYTSRPLRPQFSTPPPPINIAVSV